MTRPAFDLIDEPWIPVTYTGEPLARDVSLRQLFRDAHRIDDLAEASPLAAAALYRLLLAILHRVFGPKDDQAWAELYRAGQFDAPAIEAYLDRWHDRFDLFHPDHPFYQTPGLPASLATSIARLGHEFASGNNPVLFDHSVDGIPRPVGPALAARLLLAHQAFAVGGLISRLPGEHPSAEAGHLVKSAVLTLRGGSLYESLVLNLVRYDGAAERPFPFDPANDLPAWEQGARVTFSRREPRGYIDWLTWQARRILLLPVEGSTLVDRVIVMGGYQLPETTDPARYETMVAYRRPESPKGPEQLIPLGFQPERAFWRDVTVIFGRKDDRDRSGKSPKILTDTSARQGARLVDRHRRFELAAFGLAADRAKVFLWRREELPLPAAYLDDPKNSANLINALEVAVRFAEAVDDVLRNATWALASKFLAGVAGAAPDRQRVTALRESFGTALAYWPALDVPFRRLMADLPAAHDAGRAEDVEREWAEAVQRAARDAFSLACGAVAATARGYRAVAETRGIFESRLRESLTRHYEAFTTQYTTEEVPA